MPKTKPDQSLINSMFLQIVESDQNASVSLDLLGEEYDFSNARRYMEVEISGKPVIAIDPLNIYLHAVYHNQQQSLHFLIQAGSDHTATSTYGKDDTPIALQNSRSLRTSLVMNGGNDICWAVLSDHGDALSDLAKTYANNNLEMDVNQRQTVPFSNLKLPDIEARKHTALDIAVMQYVAQRILDNEHAEQTKAIGEQLSQAIAPLLEQFKTAGISGNIAIIPSNMQDLEPIAQITANNIFLLLEKGAIGSEEAYFPMSLDRKAAPFLLNDGFEKMSLNDFCFYNKGIFSPELLTRLTGYTPEPAFNQK